jgi:nitrite reductase/ring-hydroxylating ferredoxin subunit
VTVTEILCALSDLDATGAKEIVLTRDGARVPVFVIKWAGGIRGYVNSCPHVRLPLNWREDAFFDVTGSFLFCANHGAHFDAGTGACLRGPCKGKSLTPFPVRIDGNNIVTA